MEGTDPCLVLENIFLNYFCAGIEKPLAVFVGSASWDGFQTFLSPVQCSACHTNLQQMHSVTDFVLVFVLCSNGSGVWSDEGCVREGGDLNYSVCLCNHLTNFAILMQVVPLKVRSSKVWSVWLISAPSCWHCCSSLPPSQCPAILSLSMFCAFLVHRNALLYSQYSLSLQSSHWFMPLAWEELQCPTWI